MTASFLQRLEIFILPPGIILVLLVLALLIARKKPLLGSILSISGIVLLTTLSMPLVARYLLINLQDYPAIQSEKLTINSSEGVIVILGAGRYQAAPEYGYRDETSPLTLERLRYGAALANKLNLPVLLSGGRRNNNATSEAVMMNQVMVNVFNTHPKYLEVNGANTQQQAIEVKKVLSSHNNMKIYLVTHAWHMKRAVEAFSLQGFEVQPAPMGFAATSKIDNHLYPSAAALASSSRALHEYYALIFMKLTQ